MSEIYPIYAKRFFKDKSLLTLAQHTADVLTYTGEIRREISQYLNKRFGSDNSVTTILKLLDIVAFLHDIGKISPYFQRIMRKGIKNHEFRIDNFPPLRHNMFSLFFINKDKLKQVCENNEKLYAVVLSSIAFHHWKEKEKEYLLYPDSDMVETAQHLLSSSNGEITGKILEKRLYTHFSSTLDTERNNLKGYLELIEFDEVLAKHLKKGGTILDAGVIPPYLLYFLPERLRARYGGMIDQRAWILLSGMLMRADCFASWKEQQKSENRSISEGNIEKSTGYIGNVIDKLKSSKGIREDQLWQRNLVERFRHKNVILIAPTGVGKTEFAFAWGEQDKLFYTLPMRVATNQIFDRACSLFNPEGEDQYDPYINGNVGLLHSDADLYLLEKWKNEVTEDTEGDIPKVLDLAKHLSLPINICTGDQVFPSVWKYPRYERIYATLGYSCLVVDEVQAYDPRACAAVVKMIEDVASLGGNFLLITATLPGLVKEEICKRVGDEKVEVEDLYKSDIVSRDLVKHKLLIRNKNIVDDVEEIVHIAGMGTRVLVVANTVDKAKELYEKILNASNKLKSSIAEVYLIHSRLTYKERRERESKIVEEFKNPKPPEDDQPKIVVSTQVVEASLDLDADYLFTEISPMDSLVQRMGRVMRRVNSRGVDKNTDAPFVYENVYSGPNVYVYVKPRNNLAGTWDLESGKGKVYERDLIMLTLRKLLGGSPQSLREQYKDKLSHTSGKKGAGRLPKERRIRDPKSQYSNELENEVLDLLSRKSNKDPVSISEEEKNDYVEEVYGGLLPKYSNYESKFRDTLSILDSGYVSEREEDAHRLFRDIYTIQTIEEKALCTEEFRSSFKQFLECGASWIDFKKHIIFNFVVNDNLAKYRKSSEYEMSSLFQSLKRLGYLTDLQEYIISRVKRYCTGIYVV